MLASAGWRAVRAWRFDLYGGTVLLAATRDGTGPGGDDDTIRDLLGGGARVGVRDPARFAVLQQEAQERACAVHDWLTAQRAAQVPVVGYGAASRAVALLCQAHADQT